jgi:nitrogen regulatory protein PII
MSDVVIFTIVQKGKAEKVFAAARNAGSTGGTIFYAHGTAPSRLLSMLGLGDSHKEMIVILAEEEKENAIITAMCGVEKCQGAVWVAPCGKRFQQRLVQNEQGEDTMDTAWEMINVICNQGYSEEVMAAARGAGAGGGTVVNGRGTGTPADVKFFGIQLVPEKEMLMILVEKEKEQEVFNAIVALPCLQEPGSGIVYTMPVTRFQLLGGKSSL